MYLSLYKCTYITINNKQIKKKRIIYFAKIQKTTALSKNEVKKMASNILLGANFARRHFYSAQPLFCNGKILIIISLVVSCCRKSAVEAGKSNPISYFQLVSYNQSYNNRFNLLKNIDVK